MNLVLFDDANRVNLLPLTFTRPAAALRTGILTIARKWECHLDAVSSYHTQAYLQTKYPLVLADDNLFVNGTVLPDETLVSEVRQLAPGEGLMSNGFLIAIRLNRQQAESFNALQPAPSAVKQSESDSILKISAPYHLFSLNDVALRRDFALLTQGRKSAPISSTNQVIAPENIFLEEGARVECSILNASTGPIYIDKEAEIMEGCMVRGGFYLGEHSVLKMGAKIYGATTIGPHSKVGGEVNNSVITGYSNKAHDGFLGNSVLGEWCNLGADTNNSNLKNNYAEVKLWDYATEGFRRTGLYFCGLIMGDHSKCGINTMFNTGTVVGVSANIFGDGFPRNFIPSFSWGGAAGFETYQLNKAAETARMVYGRRNMELDQADMDVLRHVFEETARYRVWDKAEAQ